MQRPPQPSARPFAVLSDIHGNLEALRAVLADLPRHDVGAIYAAGDHLLGGPEPLETWRLMMKHGVVCARGLGERALVEVDTDELEPESEDEAQRLAFFEQTRLDLGELVMQQLRNLPETLRVPLIDGNEAIVVHGAPRNPFAELTHDLEDEEMLALVEDDPADLVLCGSTHVPFIRDLGEVRVVNCGSVGQAPEGRIAHYALVSPAMDGGMVSSHFVEY